MSSTALVHISVVRNLHAPEFEDSDSITIPDITVPGTIVYTMLATDADEEVIIRKYKRQFFKIFWKHFHRILRKCYRNVSYVLIVINNDSMIIVKITSNNRKT